MMAYMKIMTESIWGYLRSEEIEYEYFGGEKVIDGFGYYNKSYKMKSVEDNS